MKQNSRLTLVLLLIALMTWGWNLKLLFEIQTEEPHDLELEMPNLDPLLQSNQQALELPPLLADPFTKQLFAESQPVPVQEAAQPEPQVQVEAPPPERPLPPPPPPGRLLLIHQKNKVMEALFLDPAEQAHEWRKGSLYGVWEIIEIRLSGVKLRNRETNDETTLELP